MDCPNCNSMYTKCEHNEHSYWNDEENYGYGWKQWFCQECHTEWVENIDVYPDGSRRHWISTTEDA